MINTVLFDLDGVLLDAKEIHYKALNFALRKFSSYEIPRNLHLSAFDGLPTKTKLEKLSEMNLIESDCFPEIKLEKQKRTIEMIKENVFPSLVQLNLLRWLKKNGYMMGICTNSVRETLEVSMEKLEIGKFMSIVLSNEDVIKHKPDPEIYIKAMINLGVSPDRTLILEDNENGILAAKRSRANVLEVGLDDVNLENVKRRLNV